MYSYQRPVHTILTFRSISILNYLNYHIVYLITHNDHIVRHIIKVFDKIFEKSLY